MQNEDMHVFMIFIRQFSVLIVQVLFIFAFSTAGACVTAVTDVFDKLAHSLEVNAKLCIEFKTK